MIRTALAVLTRPSLWRTGLRQWWRLTPRRWWARPPFLPRPDRGWVRFRLETQYGSPDRRPEPADVLRWLDWCRDFEAVSGRQNQGLLQ